MAEETAEEKKAFTFPLNLKEWLPYILIGGSWLINFGRGSSTTDALNTQVKTDSAQIDALNKNIQALNVTVGQLQVTIQDMRREADQDRAYRESINKK